MKIRTQLNPDDAMSKRSYFIRATISQKTGITVGAVLGISLLIGAETYLVGVTASRRASTLGGAEVTVADIAPRDYGSLDISNKAAW